MVNGVLTVCVCVFIVGLLSCGRPWDGGHMNTVTAATYGSTTWRVGGACAQHTPTCLTNESSALHTH